MRCKPFFISNSFHLLFSARLKLLYKGSCMIKMITWFIAFRLWWRLFNIKQMCFNFFFFRPTSNVKLHKLNLMLMGKIYFSCSLEQLHVGSARVK